MKKYIYLTVFLSSLNQNTKNISGVTGCKHVAQCLVSILTPVCSLLICV